VRRLVASAFTQHRTERLAPRVQAVTDALLDDMAAAAPGPVDLVASFGYPLPIMVISDLLGGPPGDLEEFRSWTKVLVNLSLYPPETYLVAATSMVEYARGQIAEKRGRPADDLLSALVAARDGGDRLSEDELSSMVFLLLVAGHETTVNLLCSGTHALLTHPDQLALLRAEPERMPAAVEELLRFDGPLMVTIPFVARAPVQLAGTAIPAGEVVLPALLAANRDAQRFPEPDRLDITRPSAPHVAFGYGVHHCLGAALARLEGRIALAPLIARFPGLRLADPATEPARAPGLVMNGMPALPVLLD
jgi:cytochrome P450